MSVRWLTRMRLTGRAYSYDGSVGTLDKREPEWTLSLGLWALCSISVSPSSSEPLMICANSLTAPASSISSLVLPQRILHVTNLRIPCARPCRRVALNPRTTVARNLKTSRRVSKATLMLRTLSSFHRPMRTSREQVHRGRYW